MTDLKVNSSLREKYPVSDFYEILNEVQKQVV